MVKVLKEADSKYVPLKYNLNKNHSKPFIDNTTINYSLLSKSKVRFLITNENGEIVYKSNPTEQDAGSYRMEITPDKLPMGIYFFQFITSENFTTMRLKVDGQSSGLLT